MIGESGSLGSSLSVMTRVLGGRFSSGSGIFSGQFSSSGMTGPSRFPPTGTTFPLSSWISSGLGTSRPGSSGISGSVPRSTSSPSLTPSLSVSESLGPVRSSLSSLLVRPSSSGSPRGPFGPSFAPGADSSAVPSSFGSRPLSFS